MPGESITSPPPGSTSSWRSVVVCRPSSSSSRVSFVAMTSSPSQRLTSVDLPTPEEPSSTAVVARLDPRAQRVAALAGDGGHDVDRDAERDRLDLGDELPRILERSAFVSTISGVAPLSQIVTR